MMFLIRQPLFLLLLLTQQLAAAVAFSIQQERWDYKGHPIGYDQAGSVESSSTPIVLLNGFGVGSFHQHRLMEQLCTTTTSQRSIYGMDYLGQGRSWPRDCNDGFGTSEQDLQYSGDLWVDQAIQFIEQVVLPNQNNKQNKKKKPVQKVHLVGNSVGGHLAVFLACLRPDLVESVTLLNATPVWGLNLPGWSGSLPAPTVPRIIGRYMFDRMRDFGTIRRFLENSYFSEQAYDDELVRQIRECTEGNGGHAAFASIMWSPPVRAVKDEADSSSAKGFYDCLAALECDVLVVFGKDDPWCKPAFAKKMLQALDTRQPDKVHRYVELSNVGHCPNHEAPQAVSQLLQLWVNAADNRRSLQLVNGPTETFTEQWGDITVQELGTDSIPMGLMDRVATAFVG
ncbi:hydrolase, alpha beta fold family protein [Seminavis robusta]|uniref:Hydrolase, alpha beta fold family protein n=1 Tax=Seminavis robusta TaxID=568900 RepID=A0A9N8DGB2_9STRA|nr:hydrolase, alpha beta fold family protein [Seminavis robusta]|eukprot:Sro130_g062100.1 hydrolase, alpha beta fold family protein (398) ;mRNA; f:101639-103147